MKYKAVAEGVARAGLPKDSPKLRKVELGELIHVTDRVDLGDCVRLRTVLDGKEAWVSESTAKGKLLFELVKEVSVDGGDDSEPEDPDPTAEKEEEEEDSDSEPEDPDLVSEGVAAAQYYLYKAVASGVIREGAAMDSDKAGRVEEGETIIVTERQEVDGTMRVKFDRGWTSVTSKSGKVLLEEVEEVDGDDSEPEDPDMASDGEEEQEGPAAVVAGTTQEQPSVTVATEPAAVAALSMKYKALAPSQIRAGAAMNSEPAGQMEVGQIIVVSERKELDGTVRVRFHGGWASVTSKSGKLLLEEVVDSQPTAAVAAAVEETVSAGAEKDVPELVAESMGSVEAPAASVASSSEAAAAAAPDDAHPQEADEATSGASREGEKGSRTRLKTVAPLGTEAVVVQVTVLAARGLKKMDRFGTADPYVVLRCGSGKEYDGNTVVCCCLHVCI